MSINKHILSQEGKKLLLDYHTLQNEEWFQLFVEEAKATIVEAVSASRWILVEGYWKLGELIRTNEIVNEYAKGNREFLASLAQNIGISTRTIYYCLQAYDKYPQIDTLPEGKNISWNKLITTYLPESSAKEKDLDENLKLEHKCPKCGYEW